MKFKYKDQKFKITKKELIKLGLEERARILAGDNKEKIEIISKPCDGSKSIFV
jgi:hypothetical protein